LTRLWLLPKNPKKGTPTAVCFPGESWSWTHRASFHATNIAPVDYKVFAVEVNADTFVQSAVFAAELGTRAVSVTVHSGGLESLDLKLIPAEEVQRIKDKLQ